MEEENEKNYIAYSHHRHYMHDAHAFGHDHVCIRPVALSCYNYMAGRYMDMDRLGGWGYSAGARASRRAER